MDQNQSIVVKAKIRLRTTSEGGRKTPIKTGYRPNHLFELLENGSPLTAYMGEIQFDDIEFLELGQSKVLIVQFIRFNTIEQFIKVGQKWQINEGPRVVGDGEIIEIL